jgi:hypothetical protein
VQRLSGSERVLKFARGAAIGSVHSLAVAANDPCRRIEMTRLHRLERCLSQVTALCLVVSVQMIFCKYADAQQELFRIQLRETGQFLDADHCSANLTLINQSAYANGACQLWRVLPAEDGWIRLQLVETGQFLDADHCSQFVRLNPGSDFHGSACQLWRFVGGDGPWHRIQLKETGQFLDADHCGPRLMLNPGPGFAKGACQQWRLLRVEQPTQMEPRSPSNRNGPPPNATPPEPAPSRAPSGYHGPIDPG